MVGDVKYEITNLPSSELYVRGSKAKTNAHWFNYLWTFNKTVPTLVNDRKAVEVSEGVLIRYNSACRTSGLPRQATIQGVQAPATEDLSHNLACPLASLRRRKVGRPTAFCHQGSFGCGGAWGSLHSRLHSMDCDQLYTEFNVGATRQICLGSEVRSRAEHELELKEKLNANEYVGTWLSCLRKRPFVGWCRRPLVSVEISVGRAKEGPNRNGRLSSRLPPSVNPSILLHYPRRKSAMTAEVSSISKTPLLISGTLTFPCLIPSSHSYLSPL
ncbi:hypothetical protein Tco_1561162 [Tanacetum coccineum]